MSRYDTTGRLNPTSSRWNVRRLTEPNRLWGSNGVAFGPDGRVAALGALAIAAFIPTAAGRRGSSTTGEPTVLTAASR